MNCEDFMKKAVVFLTRNDTAQAAARLMADSNVGFLPVCEGRKCVGVLTDRDLALRVVAQEKAASTPVNDIMTRDIVTCSPNDGIEIAADAMIENQISRLAVTNDDGELVGIISLSDLPTVDAEAAYEAFRGVSAREAHLP